MIFVSLCTLSAPLISCLSVHEDVTLDFSDMSTPGSVTLSILLSALLFPGSPAPVGCSKGPWAVNGQAVVGAGTAVCCGASDWLREQMLPKLLQSAPQCCSHCPRSRRPTHILTSSPHFSRKFISSTYGLGHAHISKTNYFLHRLNEY